MGGASTDQIQMTGARLRELLTNQDRYRRKWMVHVHRRRGEISYAAVSQVVALYLWESSQRPERDVELPRKLRDRVRHALRGESLTQETLNWLLEAFEFEPADQRALWKLFAGRSDADLGQRGVGPSLSGPAIPIVVPQRHRTTAMFSRYYIGADQQLDRIETSHIVVATEDDVSTYAFSPRESVSRVEVVSGGEFIGFHDSAPGFVGVEIALDRRLKAGQPASLQYVTYHEPTEDPCLEVRRAARRRLENVDLRVIFEGASRPSAAWWCVWDAYTDGAVVDSVGIEPILDRRELHQYVPWMEHAVAGFRWTL